MQGVDAEHIARRFYDQFKIEHDKFLSYVTGIPSLEHRRWYTSITLCRLMFVYFIQKKGLLNGDEDYLSHRLHTIQESNGTGAFFSFYRKLLYRLFHYGSGSVGKAPALPRKVGGVLYLNGGLFEEQPLDREYEGIQIADVAFEGIFAFLNKWQWRLDDSPPHSLNEVNPDTLGYIFEQYTNRGRREIGAYYTQEDITKYIASNTIIPFLFDAAERICPEAFAPGEAIWRELQKHPDHYIYEAVRKGCNLPLPPAIAAGLDDVSRRTGWNKAASKAYALPAETWREVVTRRKHYENTRHLLTTGEIRTINDLITHNLDISSFAYSVIERCEDIEVVQAFYEGIRGVKVLDPTCGSGAFLLAAMNVLEPLYSKCIQRLTAMANKPGDQFFILKSIIANNIYGVDIAREVVEICKLRLFLKLISRIHSEKDLGALPDIDFNIRTGNALLGAVSYRAPSNSSLESLDSRLPFHWFNEFHNVMQNGGFDVIIGNPPYVEYGKVSDTYTLTNYTTLPAGNLYALTMERSSCLLARGGRFGMIVPSSATCTDRYQPLQKILLEQSALHISSFSDQHGKLFDIPHPRLCIVIYKKGPGAKNVFSTPYLKLGRELRAYLFQRLEYIEVTQQVRPGIIPRYSSCVEQAIHTKLFEQAHRLGDYLCKTGSNQLYYTRKLSWFVQVTPFIPQIMDEQGRLRKPSELKTLHFSSSELAEIAFVALNSNLFYWFITTGSDCRNLNMREVLGLPLSIDAIAGSMKRELQRLAGTLVEDLQAHAEFRKMRFKNADTLTIQCIFPGRSRHIIDEIDHVLAQFYSFTAEELDFILNYDGKYRLGRQDNHK